MKPLFTKPKSCSNIIILNNVWYLINDSLFLFILFIEKKKNRPIYYDYNILS